MQFVSQGQSKKGTEDEEMIDLIGFEAIEQNSPTFPSNDIVPRTMREEKKKKKRAT